MIKFAIEEEGLAYLDTRGGQYWCELADIDPASLTLKYETALRAGLIPKARQPERIRKKASPEDQVYRTLAELTHIWCR